MSKIQKEKKNKIRAEEYKEVFRMLEDAETHKRRMDYKKTVKNAPNGITVTYEWVGYSFGDSGIRGVTREFRFRKSTNTEYLCLGVFRPCGNEMIPVIPLKTLPVFEKAYLQSIGLL